MIYKQSEEFHPEGLQKLASPFDKERRLKLVPIESDAFDEGYAYRVSRAAQARGK